MDIALAHINKRPVDDRVIIFSGIFSDTYMIPDNTSLTGLGDAVIGGSLTIGSRANLSDFTITGNDDGLYLGNGSETSATNLTIINNVGDGVDAEKNAQLTIRDSVLQGNRKGIYMRSNSTTTIQNSLVQGNLQEGIDIRGYSDSIVEGNTVIENGESGMELIAGGSTVTASDNIVSNNTKSGIVVEYSKTAPELGSLYITDNTIQNNQKIGVRCVSRTGGKRPSKYFSKSTLLENNDIGNSGDQDFSDLCKFGSVPFLGLTTLEVSPQP